MNVIVDVTYTFLIKADDEHEAKLMIDNAISFIITNPQTGERVNPEIDTYEKQ